MFEKKNFVLNCNVCDTRKMKEEDYTCFEKIAINTDLLLVSEKSKSILNRLPALINQDDMIELSDDAEIALKTVNGSYEITGNTAVTEHTVLAVNGSLRIHPGTDEVLSKYELISVNGSVKCPKSLEGYLSKMTVNGSVSTYPDDCVILKREFEIDKYFPLRAKENGRYYAEKIIYIKDSSVDITKLSQKNVAFQTQTFLVPEALTEACVPLFDEQVDIVVIPDGMELLYGSFVLNEELIQKYGKKLFVYGKLTADENLTLEQIDSFFDALIVKGTLAVMKEQKAAFAKPEIMYDKLEIIKKGRKLTNMVSVKVDNNLLEHSPDGVQITNAAKVTIAPEVTPQAIMDKLTLTNCAHIACAEEQESAVAAIATNVGQIGNVKDKNDESGNDFGNIFNLFKDAANTKVINADNYVL